MEAAAHGKSTLGIPKKVAKEFVAADKGSVVSKRKRNNKIDRSKYKVG